MSRRDTIIVAVLINTGLLAVLFMLAIHNEDVSLMQSFSPGSEIVESEFPSSNDHDLAVQMVQSNQNSRGNQNFQSDLNQHQTQKQSQVQNQQIAQSGPVNGAQPVRRSANQVSSHDELDQVLKNYANSSIPPTTSVVISPSNELVRSSSTGGSSSTLSSSTSTSSSSSNQQLNSPSSEQTSNEKIVEITVKRGDSLDKIARANGATVQSIMYTNNLTSARIDVGQVLKIPVGQAAQKKSNPSTAISAQEKSDNKLIADNQAQYYTIKQGDNPWKIAKQFHVKFDHLLKMNGLNEEKARNLRPGDVLRVQ